MSGITGTIYAWREYWTVLGMIVEELKEFGEMLGGSSAADYERNNEVYAKLLQKIIQPRVYKALEPMELVGVYGGLAWLSQNSEEFAEVVDSDLLTGLSDFDGDGNNLYVVLDLMLSQESFPSAAIDFYLQNPEFLELGFTEPDWVAKRELTEKQFLRLWNCLPSADFKKGYREQMLKNPHLPQDLKGLSVWED